MDHWIEMLKSDHTSWDNAHRCADTRVYLARERTRKWGPIPDHKQDADKLTRVAAEEGRPVGMESKGTMHPMVNGPKVLCSLNKSLAILGWQLINTRTPARSLDAIPKMQDLRSKDSRTFWPLTIVCNGRKRRSSRNDELGNESTIDVNEQWLRDVRFVIDEKTLRLPGSHVMLGWLRRCKQSSSIHNKLITNEDEKK